MRASTEMVKFFEWRADARVFFSRIVGFGQFRANMDAQIPAAAAQASVRRD